MREEPLWAQWAARRAVADIGWSPPAAWRSDRLALRALLIARALESRGSRLSVRIRPRQRPRQQPAKIRL